MSIILDIDIDESVDPTVCPECERPLFGRSVCFSCHAIDYAEEVQV